MKPVSAKCGFILITVLVVTAVGLLFGAGALLLFRFQCQLRIDRQHELEKIYAVRSALNFIRTSNNTTLGGRERRFRFQTVSGRNLGLVVRPVDRIFPVLTNESHLVIESSNPQRNFRIDSCYGQYCDALDYEYGALGVTNFQESVKNMRSGRYGLMIDDPAVTNKYARWWVNIGMRGTGGWLQEDYGRRYYFQPMSFVGQTSLTGDIVRLCIIRNVTNELQEAGRKHGWPLSQDGERALVFEIQPFRPDSTASGNNVVARKTVFEYVHTNGTVVSRCLAPPWIEQHYQAPFGVQISGDKIFIFYIDLGSDNAEVADPTWSGYNFYPQHPKYVQMDPKTREYFAEERQIGRKWYSGMFTNRFGKIEAPELRVVFEVEAAAFERTVSDVDFLTDFRVTPAYQYDVLLEHPASVTNLATIAQIVGEYSDAGLKHTVLTYDTHGTENKGFRKDEREWERKRGIR